MKTIRVEIYVTGINYRKGNLYFNDRLILTTLEPTDKQLQQTDTLTKILSTKQLGKCAIPYGTYEVKMLWSNKFKKILPHLINVPGFENILMHVGNNSNDTEGCILVGSSQMDSQDWISYSLTGMRILNDYICDGVNEEIWITIKPKTT